MLALDTLIDAKEVPRLLKMRALHNDDSHTPLQYVDAHICAAFLDANYATATAKL